MVVVNGSVDSWRQLMLAVNNSGGSGGGGGCRQWWQWTADDCRWRWRQLADNCGSGQWRRMTTAAGGER